MLCHLGSSLVTESLPQEANCGFADHLSIDRQTCRAPARSCPKQGEAGTCKDYLAIAALVYNALPPARGSCIIISPHVAAVHVVQWKQQSMHSRRDISAQLLT